MVLPPSRSRESMTRVPVSSQRGHRMRVNAPAVSLTTPRVVPLTKVPQHMALGHPVEVRSQPELFGAASRGTESIEPHERCPEHRSRAQAHDPRTRNGRTNTLFEPASETRISGPKDPAGQHDVDVAARDSQASGDRDGHPRQLVSEAVDDAARHTVIG